MNIVFFTGAGISRESGLKTFRDEDGLWDNYKVEDICTPHAWKQHPQLVLDFYNKRRKEIKNAFPNPAHLAISELEKEYNVTVITQNIDNLHERAGSKNVIHLHGNIMEKHSEFDFTKHYDCHEDIILGDLAEDNGQMRPHVVFFDEEPENISEARLISKHCKHLIIVGTSLQVAPANLVAYKTGAKHIWIVNPNPPSKRNTKYTSYDFKNKIRTIRENASVGVPQVIKEIKRMNK